MTRIVDGFGRQMFDGTIEECEDFVKRHDAEIAVRERENTLRWTYFFLGVMVASIIATLIYYCNA